MGDMSHNEKDRRKEKLQQFINDLMGFHAAVGTPLMRLPTINGQEVNLLELYEAVTGLGGWERVSDNNQWPEVGSKLEIPSACVNSSVALKQIYLRFLDKYEKTHFVHKGVRGEVEDELDFNIKRMNKQSARTLYTIPTVYNDDQHNLTDEQRSLLGLNTLTNPERFEKLQLSLVSPLPNEQDFAINVCTLLSIQVHNNPVDLRNSPRLLINLLAHAGVFTDVFFKDFICEQYEKDRGYEMKNFWRDTLKHDSFVWLTNENNFVNSEENDDCLMLDDSDRSYMTDQLVNYDFFIERVCQVARIILNLTQQADNSTFLARDKTSVRFVLLCSDCRYKKISELGWDIMNSIASNICLRTLGLKEIIFIVKEGVMSEDISEILSSLRALSELAKLENNKTILLECMDGEVFSKLCTYLTLQDVVIILSTLEALYALSNLDKIFCDSIVHTRGSLSILVLLLKFRLPISASFGTWKNIRVSETIFTEDGSRLLAEKDLGAISVRPPEIPKTYYLISGAPPEAYRRVENVANCCATGECRRSQKDEASSINEVVTLTSSPAKTSLLCNALRNCVPNGVKPVTVSTVGPAVTLKAHLEEPVTKIVKVSNPGNQTNFSNVKLAAYVNSSLSNNTDHIAKKVMLNGKESVASPLSPPSKSEESNSSNSDDMQIRAGINNHSPEESIEGSKLKFEMSNKDLVSTKIDLNCITEDEIKLKGAENTSVGTIVANGIQDEVKVNGMPEVHDYLCEWRGCLRKFKAPNSVFVHICSSHCPQSMLEGACLWGNCKAGKMVYRILIKHIHREHCNPEVMLPIKARTAVRPRPSLLKEKRLQQAPPPPLPPPSPMLPFSQASPSVPPPSTSAPMMTATAPEQLHPNVLANQSSRLMPPPPPHPPPPHPPPQHLPPGHPLPPGARYYGPPSLANTLAGDRISESVRLTSALILRNVACCCPSARRRLHLYEQQIVEAAAIDSEASRAAAECLSYLWT